MRGARGGRLGPVGEHRTNSGSADLSPIVYGEHLAKLMAELGWAAVRVRDLTRGGYKEQVRGYTRSARAVQ